MLDRQAIEAYAMLFEYPSEQRVVDEIEVACRHVEGSGASPRGGARGLNLLLAERGANGCQEHFTQIFDVNAERSLEMGWHLYGEDYKRGAFLVQMRQMLRQLGIEEGSELPDYLPTLLRALARLHEGKAAIFSTSYLQPAITRMFAGFEEKETPYGHVVEDLLRSLEATYGPTETADVPNQAQPYTPAPSSSPSCSP